MKLTDIQTSDADDAADGWCEWLVVYRDDDSGRVRFAHEYTNTRTGPTARATWPDQGSGFDEEHLDAIVEALEQAQLLRDARKAGAS